MTLIHRLSQSVDIRKIVRSKMGKLDKKIDDNKKQTLKALEEQISYDKGDYGKNKHIALNPFEDKLYLENSNNSQRGGELVEYRENSYLEDGISFKRLEKKSFDNYEVYKQENMERKDMLEVRQKEAKVNRILKNKHIYRSKNHYNNTNIENIPYEKDSHLERSLRFQNKINKKN
jgi:hypothetical protein